MIKQLITNKELNDFLRKNREKSLRFLKGQYSLLQKEDLEDIYQDSSVIFYEKIKAGLLSKLESSEYYYFLGICKNQAMKWLKDNQIQQISFKEDIETDEKNENVDEDRLNDLESWAGTYEMEDNYSHEVYQDFLGKVKNGVRNMPAPCNHVLWSYYWDGFSHKQIAELYGMKNEDVSKTLASRCKKKFSEFIKRIRPTYGK